MRSYIVRRLLLIIPTLLVMTAVAFFTVRLIPGDMIDVMKIWAEVEIDRPAIERQLGLDQPALIQYGRWMGLVPQMDGSYSGLLEGDFGDSWWIRQPVIGQIRRSWPVTLQLGLMGLIIAQLIALPIGVFSALRQDNWGDYIGRSFAIFCISVPSFWLGTIVVVMPSIWWGSMPPIMLIPFAEDPIGNLKMFILPAIVLGMETSGMTMRMTRTMMLEVLRQDYIRTAWAKGLREILVVIRHASKNALIPVVTLLGLQMPILIGGTAIIEQIFSLPGMGRLTVNALINKDEPVVMLTLLFFAVGMGLINLVVDLTYAYLDPRVRYT